MSKFKVGQWVTVAGEGMEAFKIEDIDEQGKRVGVDGCWESMRKCRIVPANQVEKVEKYIYIGK